ncbi:hypothetical protein [Caldisericum sp.]|uniref:hypothetical protein n=1 Tax=Caldisericum sp. TaxID=2499687 RepID=UPI003D0FA4E3
MIKSGLDLLMLLLYANKQEKIEGITKLVKLLFLLIKEGNFKEFEKEYGFETYNYGPWSSQVLNFTETVREMNLIKSEERELKRYEERDVDLIEAEVDVAEIPELVENEIFIFSLTADGLKVGRVLYKRLTEDERTKIEDIKKKFNRMSLSELIRYVYLKYPEFTKKSKIKEKFIPRSMFGVSPELRSLSAIYFGVYKNIG